MEEIHRTTVDIPASLLKAVKLQLTKKYGNPHGHWSPLIQELLQQWVEDNKE